VRVIQKGGQSLVLRTANGALLSVARTRAGRAEGSTAGRSAMSTSIKRWVLLAAIVLASLTAACAAAELLWAGRRLQPEISPTQT